MQRIHVTIRPLNREDSVLYFPPESFGPFRVLHQIGAGALGPVFRAYEPSDGRPDRLVAIKVFRLDITPEQTASLVAALQALVKQHLDHPNMAAPLAAGLEHGSPYLAQEYVVGDSLDVVLRERGRLPLDELVPLVDALARALDHAAARGVQHGSLHMRDIVLAASRPRLTGFGIAAALASVGAALPPRLPYAAPDGPSDVYSLAAIAFEAATGRRPSAENLGEFAESHGDAMREAFVSALTSGAGTSAGASEFARRLHTAFAPPVADDPLDRVIDLGPPRELTPHAAAEASADSADGDDSAVAPPRRWPFVAAFMAFAIVTAVSVGVFLNSSRDDARDDRRQASGGVDETTVDLPAADPPAKSEPSRRSSAPSPAPVRTPAPAPSRPASGAARVVQAGSLLIRSTPADADVLVNGRARGKTPVVLRDLPLGSYTIRIARDGYAAEQRSLEITSRRPTASTSIDLRRVPEATAPPDAGTGELNVQSRPAGARVFVNDRLAGATPVAIASLPAGPAIVRIEMDGYRPWVTSVRVRPGERARVAASLESTHIQ